MKPSKIENPQSVTSKNLLNGDPGAVSDRTQIDRMQNDTSNSAFLYRLNQIRSIQPICVLEETRFASFMSVFQSSQIPNPNSQIPIPKSKIFVFFRELQLV